MKGVRDVPGWHARFDRFARTNFVSWRKLAEQFAHDSGETELFKKAQVPIQYYTGALPKCEEVRLNVLGGTLGQNRLLLSRNPRTVCYGVYLTYLSEAERVEEAQCYTEAYQKGLAKPDWKFCPFRFSKGFCKFALDGPVHLVVRGGKIYAPGDICGSPVRLTKSVRPPLGYPVASSLPAGASYAKRNYKVTANGGQLSCRPCKPHVVVRHGF